ncbi:hypothetical protein M758_2G232300 [Ceratodon purpureus]|nr:hypothetical protein M758_2G232300 [Ceratodon purpureus]
MRCRYQLQSQETHDCRLQLASRRRPKITSSELQEHIPVLIATRFFSIKLLKVMYPNFSVLDYPNAEQINQCLTAASFEACSSTSSSPSRWSRPSSNIAPPFDDRL